MGTDFFDSDLLPSRKNADEEERQDQDVVSIRPLAEPGAGRMTRRKEQRSQQVATAVREVELLKMRQATLERERSDLEDMTKRQEDYEHGKKEIVEKLNRSVVLLEKEQEQANRMGELLAETQTRFRETLADIQSIKEESWPDEDFRGQLNEALTKVESARSLYRKAIARIEATSWHRNPEADGRRDFDEPADRKAWADLPFRVWLRIGLALTLPVVAILFIAFVVNLFLMGGFR
jgi:DNA repair exonuclease SbcCD ATPase subunit